MADLLVARSARPRARGWFWAPFLSAGVAAVGLLAGCQEKLTAPGECPELCPGGQLTVFDTVLAALPARDSSFAGYLGAGQNDALLVSSGLPGSEDRAVVRFIRRPDSILVNTTPTGYDIDSVAINFAVLGRDTSVSGVRVVLYRLPATVDSTTTFAAIDAELVDANLIDTVVIPADSTAIRTVLSGADLARVAIPVADSGVLAIGMRVAAPQPTGLRIATAATGSGVTMTTYVTLDTEDEAVQGQVMSRGPAFNTFVAQGTPAFDPDLLHVGGEPSARTLLRFEWPTRLRDSVSIVRATLELVPAAPLFGLPNDPTFIEARPVLGDLGAKSPLCVPGGACGGTILPGATLMELAHGSADTVRFEVPRIVRTWQGPNGAAPAMFLLIRPEAATFMRPVFFSTRSGTGAPRLRISYVPLSSFGGP